MVIEIFLPSINTQLQEVLDKDMSYEDKLELLEDIAEMTTGNNHMRVVESIKEYKDENYEEDIQMIHETVYGKNF